MKKILLFYIVHLLELLNLYYVNGQNTTIPWKAKPHIIRCHQQKLLKHYLDLNVDPCEDFNNFVCGKWDEVHSMPEKSSLVYNGQNLLEDEITQVIATFFLNRPKKVKINSDKNQEISKREYNYQHLMNDAFSYYSSCLNETRILKRGYKPLKRFLKETIGEFPKMKNFTKSPDWIRVLAKLRTFGQNSLMLVTTDVESHESQSKNIIYIVEPPKWEGSIIASNHYEALELLKNLGFDDESTNQILIDILNFEQNFDSILKDEDKRPFIIDRFKHLSVEQLNYKYPFIKWKRFFSLLLQRTVSNFQVIHVDFEFLDRFANLIPNTDPQTLTNYMLIRFGLFAKTYIVPSSDDRHLMCVKETMNQMNIAVTFLFMKEFLRSKKRQDVVHIFYTIKEKLREILDKSVWIDNLTKQKANYKLDNLSVDIGLPRHVLKLWQIIKWYRPVKICQNLFFENSMNLLRLESLHEFRSLGVSDIPTLEEPPTKLAAAYDQGRNSILIQVGTLQLPYYHHQFPFYMKFGVIGFIIGHELIHGFDNIGINFNAVGEQQKWMSEESRKEYSKRTQCLINQYNQLDVNGVFTLSENIADQGGLKVAYLSYKNWLKEHEGDHILYREKVKGLNLTSEQLFFVGYTQWRCEISLSGFGSTYNSNDPHPDEKTRIIGTLSNSEFFAHDFQCSKNSTLNPMQKCKIW